MKTSRRAARRFGCAAAFAWAFAVSDPSPSSAQVPPFRSNASLVRVHVVVRARDGQPVRGLRREDFQLFEDGRPVTIDLFAGPDAPTARTVPTMTANNGAFTNRFATGTGATLTAILLDGLNTGPEEQLRARDHLTRFLRDVRPGELTALFVIGSAAVSMVNEFSDDQSTLLAALSASAATRSAAVDRGADGLELASGYRGRAALEMSAAQARDHAAATAEALRVVVEFLRGIDGRKNLVWLSSAFPLALKSETSAAAVKRIGDLMNDADVALYPVDVRGLASKKFFLSNVTGPLAAATGGVGLETQNDAAAAMRTIVESSRDAYVLGYSPAAAEWDGRFHEMRVVVARGDVDLRYRHGFVALAGHAEPQPSRQEAVSRVLRNSLPMAAVALSVQIAPGESEQNQSAFTLTMHVDPESILLDTANADWTGSVDVAIAWRYVDGRIVDVFRGGVDVSVPASRHDAFLRDGFAFRQPIAVRADATDLRIAIRDAASGAIGSIVIPATDVARVLKR